jgi:hypothetical protein
VTTTTAAAMVMTMIMLVAKVAVLQAVCLPTIAIHREAQGSIERCDTTTCKWFELGLKPMSSPAEEACR